MIQQCDFPAGGFGIGGIEPAASGAYVDRDGDIWEKSGDGWHLLLQQGVEVDPDSAWDWTEGCVRDYAPFAPVVAEIR